MHGAFLLVENHPDVARETRRLLERYAPVTLAETAQDAIDRVDEWPYWAGILVDLNLHDTTGSDELRDRGGYVVAKYARSRRPAALTTVYTAYRDEELREKLRQFGIGWLDKNGRDDNPRSWAQRALRALSGLRLEEQTSRAEQLLDDVLRGVVANTAQRYGLTPTESRVLIQTVELFNNMQRMPKAEQVATELEMVEGTHGNHVRSIIRKAGVDKIADLVTEMQREAAVEVARRLLQTGADAAQGIPADSGTSGVRAYRLDGEERGQRRSGNDHNDQ